MALNKQQVDELFLAYRDRKANGDEFKKYKNASYEDVAEQLSKPLANQESFVKGAKLPCGCASWYRKQNTYWGNQPPHELTPEDQKKETNEEGDGSCTQDGFGERVSGRTTQGDSRTNRIPSRWRRRIYILHKEEEGEKGCRSGIRVSVRWVFGAVEPHLEYALPLTPGMSGRLRREYLLLRL